ncbi:hypothetical protein [Halovivax limisalsi]|uniref:hypothetical protein n=1 Tax=Halovivax limisalsi TaxID=1453760 RepID=UPI001FFC2F12|nr:hypothetical protein [Halovivax limisalsi]
MNRLAPAGEGRWELPRHAHLVVSERLERGLLTIYDCAAAQQPPTATLLGTLERVDADAETRPNPTGRVVSLREPATLVATGADRYAIESG